MEPCIARCVFYITDGMQLIQCTMVWVTCQLAVNGGHRQVRIRDYDLQYICILYNQRDATYTMFFIIISALHVLAVFSPIIRSL